MRYYIFRNNTLEPLFGNLDARYSGYGDISSLEEGADRYIWFYQVPFGFDRCRVAEEVLSYIDKLRWVIEKIPAHKSVLVFSLVDLCPFQWVCLSVLGRLWILMKMTWNGLHKPLFPE